MWIHQRTKSAHQLVEFHFWAIDSHHHFSLLNFPQESNMHHVITPAILYMGTPVIIISTENPDGTTNLAPMSSAWWLGQRCMLGLAAGSQTTRNLQRTKQCVLNLPSDDMVAAVNRLAKTTGREDMSPFKQATGYQYVRDKFRAAGLTPMPSDLVSPPRVAECPVQMEVRLVQVRGLEEDVDDPEQKGRLLGLEVQVLRVHAEEKVVQEGNRNRIDPDQWRPLIMSFQHFYGLGERLQTSKLAEIDEEFYRGKREEDL